MAEPEALSYIYSPLKHSDSIRILELLPGRQGSPLSCRLKDVKKDENPTYEALSYAWGEPVFSKSIMEATSNAVIRITENLHGALQILRSEDAPRILWIDALCINQKDLAEKGHQVALMGSVFRDATRVVVWLGRRDCTKTMEILQELASISGLDDDFDSGLATKLMRLTTRLLALRFFEQSWFSRVWVVQEYILAQEIQLLAGHGVVSLETFRDAIHILKSIFDDYLVMDSIFENAGNVFVKLQQQINRTSYLFHFRESRIAQMKGVESSKSTNLRPTLLQCVLSLTRGRDCSNSRDYIYAILGLASDNVGITPDYSLPVYRVFSDFATQCLLAGETSVLHESGLHPTRGIDEPSFAPIITFGGDKTLQLNESPSNFSAAMLYPVKAIALPNGRVSIKGIRVDTIVNITNLINTTITERKIGLFKDDRSDKLQQTLWQACKAFLKFKDWFRGYEVARDWTDNFALFTEEKNDRNSTLWSPRPYQDLHLFDSFVRLITLEAENRTSFQKVATPLKFWSSTLGTIRASSQNRVLFKTQKGYVGIGSRWMQEGDQVVLFDGFTTPFILRNTGSDSNMPNNVWKLVGETYLMGWMRGDYFGHQVVEGMPTEPDDERHNRSRSSNILVKTSFVLC